MTSDQILSFFGEVILYGGGGAACAYLLFQYLGNSWIESKFAEKLEALRHTQALELQRLRVEIDSMLSRAIKLQEKEFQLLPEVWELLDKAYGELSSLTSPVQTYPDLNRLEVEEIEEYLENYRFTKTQKQRIVESNDKTSEFQETNFWYRLNDVEKAIGSFHDFVERNSIFCDPELKAKLTDVSDKLWKASVSKKVGHEVKDWKMQNEGWDKLKNEVEPLREEIQKDIYNRLQAVS